MEVTKFTPIRLGADGRDDRDKISDAIAMLRAEAGFGERHRATIRVLPNATAGATIKRRRIVAIEFGMWRSGRKGGTSGSITVGYGRLREQRGGTMSTGGIVSLSETKKP
jgi:hypothetical protein